VEFRIPVALVKEKLPGFFGSAVVFGFSMPGA